MAHAEILDTPLDVDRARAAVTDDHQGAVVIFEGVVRNHDHGRGVLRLDYSSHPDAGRIIAEVVARIEAEHDVTAFAEHRVGSLGIGDVALVAACASAHRAEAFTACGALVDEVKKRVPIWKNQYFEGGESEWVGLGDC